MRKRVDRLSRVAGCAVSILFGTYIQAATYTWTANSTGERDWATAGNWQGNTVFVSGGGNNELMIFANTSSDLSPTVGTLTITNVPSALSMNTLTLNGRGPNGAQVSYFIIGNSNSMWTIGDGATSTINLNSTKGGGHSGTDDLRYTIAPNLILNQSVTTFTGGGINTPGYNFAGNITESSAGYGILKSGSSALRLSGSNTYSGATSITGGRLILGNVNALPGGIGAAGGSSALEINGGSLELPGGSFERSLGAGTHQFRITGGTSGFGALGTPALIRINGDPSTELVWGSADFAPSTLMLNDTAADSALGLANTIDLNGATRTLHVNGGGAIASGKIRTSTGTAGLSKTGTGTLVVTGTNTYNGATTINGGPLAISQTHHLGTGSSSLVFNNGTLMIQGTTLTSLSGLGVSVTFNAGQPIGLHIQNENNTFTADQILSQGAGGLTKSGRGDLLLNQANTFTGATTVNSGGALILDYSAEDNSKLADASALLIAGDLVLRGGSHTEVIASTSLAEGGKISRESGTATIRLNAIGGRDRGESIHIAEDNIATTDTANGATGMLPAYITVGSHFAKNSTGGADGPLVALSPGDYTAFPASGGSIAINYQISGSLTRTGGGSANSLRIESTGDDQVLALGGNGISIARVPNACLLYGGGANGNYTITGTARIVQDNGNQEMIVNVHTGVLTVAAILKDSGSGELTKTGDGTLVAAGNNDYTGYTYVNRGTLRLANDTGAGSASQGTTISAGATLELIGDINVGTEALNLAGPMRNLSGNNTYGGAITLTGSRTSIDVDSGTLTLTGGISTSIGQDLTFGGTGDLVISGKEVSGGGNLHKYGSGSLDLIIPDNSTQWSCGSMQLNDSQINLTLNGPLSPTEPVIRVLDSLTFSASPTMTLSVSDANFERGEQYPIITVGHRAPSIRPVLNNTPGSLKWGGPGDRTLYWDTTGRGTVLILY